MKKLKSISILLVLVTSLSRGQESRNEVGFGFCPLTYLIHGAGSEYSFEKPLFSTGTFALDYKRHLKNISARVGVFSRELPATLFFSSYRIAQTEKLKNWDFGINLGVEKAILSDESRKIQIHLGIDFVSTIQRTNTYHDCPKNNPNNDGVPWSGGGSLYEVQDGFKGNHNFYGIGPSIKFSYRFSNKWSLSSEFGLAGGYQSLTIFCEDDKGFTLALYKPLLFRIDYSF